MPHATQALRFAIVLSIALLGCKRVQNANAQDSQLRPSITVALREYGLPADYSAHDDSDCTSHVIGYRFVQWLDNDSVVVGFNTSPDCRPSSGPPASQGNLRLLVFDSRGKLKTKRDVAYSNDGGEEIIAPGEAFHGPGKTLAVRIEEATNSNSAVLLLDSDLKDVMRIDRFMETQSVIDRSLVFQQGFVSQGPRTYDIVNGNLSEPGKVVTTDYPVGTMDRRVGEHGIAYAACVQEFGPNDYRASNMIYANAHRHCVVHVEPSHSSAFEAPLQQDEVAEMVGITEDSSLVSVLRARGVEHLVIWADHHTPELLPWFPSGYESKLISVTDTLSRYQGYGMKMPGKPCQIAGILCNEHAAGRLMIFDRKKLTPLVDRPLSESARADLSPNGLRYATFEASELRIYSLPDMQ